MFQTIPAHSQTVGESALRAARRAYDDAAQNYLRGGHPPSAMHAAWTVLAALEKALKAEGVDTTAPEAMPRW